MNDDQKTKTSVNQNLLNVAGQVKQAADNQRVAANQLKDLADIMEEGLKEEESQTASTE